MAIDLPLASARASAINHRVTPDRNRADRLRARASLTNRWPGHHSQAASTSLHFHSTDSQLASSLVASFASLDGCLFSDYFVTGTSTSRSASFMLVLPKARGPVHQEHSGRGSSLWRRAGHSRLEVSAVRTETEGIRPLGVSVGLSGSLHWQTLSPDN